MPPLQGFQDLLGSLSSDFVQALGQTALFAGSGFLVQGAAFGGLVDQALGETVQFSSVFGSAHSGFNGLLAEGFDGALLGTVVLATLEALAVTLLSGGVT